MCVEVFYLMMLLLGWYRCCGIFFFQAEDGIRDLVRSRGLGDVYKRQMVERSLSVAKFGQSIEC